MEFSEGKKEWKIWIDRPDWFKLIEKRINEKELVYREEEDNCFCFE